MNSMKVSGMIRKRAGFQIGLWFVSGSHILRNVGHLISIPVMVVCILQDGFQDGRDWSESSEETYEFQLNFVGHLHSSFHPVFSFSTLVCRVT